MASAPERPRIMELIFREIQLGDIEALFSVRARTRENPASIAQLATLGIAPESTAKAIASRRVRGWVCTDGGTVVGFCAGYSDTGEQYEEVTQRADTTVVCSGCATLIS